MEKAALRKTVGGRGKRDLRHTNKEFSPCPLTCSFPSSSFQCSTMLFGFLIKTDKFGVRTSRRGNRWGGEGGRLEGRRRGKKVFGEQTGGGGRGHQTERVVEEEEGAVEKSDGCAGAWKSPKKQQLKGRIETTNAYKYKGLQRYGRMTLRRLALKARYARRGRSGNGNCCFSLFFFSSASAFRFRRRQFRVNFGDAPPLAIPRCPGKTS